MAEIILIKPADQPKGSFRLLQWLEANFDDPKYTEFRMAVAFSKIHPFLKLDDKIKAWKQQGKSLKGIFGIDHKGTSYQALEYALHNFNEAYLLHAKHSTFHPKLYMFLGNEYATFFYGSNNLTPGGIETNFEGGTIISININDDASIFKNGLDCFDDLLPDKLSCSIKMDEENLTRLFKAGLLINEADPSTKRSRRTQSTKEEHGASDTINDIFGILSIKPPRAIPKKQLKPLVTPETEAPFTEAALPAKALPVSGLVIQIIPHHNGEVFLSKTAVNQNPEFFGFPFTGLTVPKKPTNASYPQRVPDPVVNIYIYDSSGSLIRIEEKYSLNTVYYATKSEIRITITPETMASVPEYSILVMTEAKPDSDYDYDMEIFCPGSTQYSDYLNSCNQYLPSGGKAVARRMGWI